MTRIAAEIADKTRWIERAQLEKDTLLRRLVAPMVPDLERGFIIGRLEFLEDEIARVRNTKDALEAIQYRPECTWRLRPRMARMRLASASPERKRA